MARARRFDWDNLALRIVSGAILAPAALAIVWFDPFHVSFLTLIAVAVSMLSYEWAPALFGSESPLGKHPKLAAYWSAIAKDPIAARLLKETREAVAQEQANARAIAKGAA